MKYHIVPFQSIRTPLYAWIRCSETFLPNWKNTKKITTSSGLMQTHAIISLKVNIIWHSQHMWCRISNKKLRKKLSGTQTMPKLLFAYWLTLFNNQHGLGDVSRKAISSLRRCKFLHFYERLFLWNNMHWWVTIKPGIFIKKIKSRNVDFMLTFFNCKSKCIIKVNIIVHPSTK